MINPNAATLPSVSATAIPTSCICRTVIASPFSVPLRICAHVGSSTMARTIARSSTTSHPTVSLPRSVCITRLSCRLRSDTTVDATDSDSPNTTPASSPHPSSIDAAIPAATVREIVSNVIGTATPRTDIRSRGEKCSPTPNISRITPTSATSCASRSSATKPGVDGPIKTPARR